VLDPPVGCTEPVQLGTRTVTCCSADAPLLPESTPVWKGTGWCILVGSARSP
jgi:hypothetical protein